MLVLKRKLNQDIVIDGKTVIKVVDIREGFVRLGITAPEDVRVDRREVFEQRKKEGKE